ncbi:MAG: coproporphyrinogen dehydrogenase HemZ [Lachnospiraceae bacterium]|nr:coproporphyrinogen dehydrogenase HemZ [Lachnospiraceae bacterium]
MILVKLNEANFEYDIYSLIKAFYPRENIVVDVDFKHEAPPEEISFRLVIEYSDNLIKLMEVDDKVIEFDSTDKSDGKSDGGAKTNDKFAYSDSIKIDYSDRVNTKNYLKLLLYKYLSEKTNRKLPWGTLTGIRPTKVPLKMIEDKYSGDEIYDFMRETYEISQKKAALSYKIALAEHKLLVDVSKNLGHERQPGDTSLADLCEDAYSLYVGIPFCPSTCLYCSFTSYPVGIYKDMMDEYIDALEKEIDFVSKNLGDKKLTTIYVGGGTPTSLSAEQLDRIFTMLEQKLNLNHVMEFTVEAGRPDSITKDKLQTMRDHNISRISINPQTMNDKTLKLIGRHHSVEDIRQSYEMAREMGFDDINMDLILGLPGEDAKDIAYTFSEIAKLKPDNLTVHSLALKRSARLNIQWGEYENMLMENSEDYMNLSHKVAAEMGMKPYYLYRQKNMAGNLENVGFATEGKEGLYNILIMEEKQTIIALGAGTSCKYVSDGGATVTRSENVKDVKLYIDRIDEMIDRKREKLEEMGWL